MCGSSLRNLSAFFNLCEPYFPLALPISLSLSLCLSYYYKNTVFFLNHFVFCVAHVCRMLEKVGGVFRVKKKHGFTAYSLAMS